MEFSREVVRMQESFADNVTTTLGVASQWNFTNIQTKLEDIKIDRNFAWLIFSLLIALLWFTYITHYSARVVGQILTRLLNRFVIKDGYVRIGKCINLTKKWCITLPFCFDRFTYLGCPFRQNNV